ncbi:uncharacterized protein THITE_2037188 [Thermothielavioides terrestris NRRL 8126]|uniref:Carboxylic ester hydrolase n=1 Tax=Thermothielavioides terrestris (strain ATCC 38088 / NRRL 8126) TaxID=578455 RepID=G2QVH1_THETT|nr:uncharacterized protein THITE_2037188 [Thermothielavioides terrestris NRRL 8126]AEO64661.1 hypothetical protein THITE_2037188 [Thermothielavioides terrestris NRRL 8126]
MRHLAILAAALAAATTAAAGCTRWKVGQTVKTTSGPVGGHAASLAPGVSEYLGIPYAEPPVGSLRFQPPVRYNGSKKIDGKSFGPACIPSNLSSYDADYPESLIQEYGITDVGRAILKDLMNPGLPVSEDCLTLNVWTKPQTGEKRKAVMVFVHGGSFVSGSSRLRDYWGQYFADQEDVVLVSINYRLTIFGFPGDPNGTQNLGLLDQRLAVEWVRDNIAAFGGDPSRITLFGESAGGASVDHYSTAWASDPIVAGLISQSGTAQGIKPLTADEAATLWYNATSAVGCGTANSTSADAILTCMQSVPASSIVRTLFNTIFTPFPHPYSPTIDEKIVFSNQSALPAAAVPLLIGNNDNEGGLFRVFVPGQDNDTSFWTQENQAEFVCPAAARAARSAVTDGHPTWRYRWFGVFPNTELARTPPSGAYHSSEMAVLFGNTNQTLVADTQAEPAIGKYMRSAWAAFAKDPANGLSKLGWPRYQAEGETLVRIGFENRTGTNLAKGNLYDTGC